MVRKFYVQAQDSSTSVNYYLKTLQASINVIESVGATIGVHSQLIKEEVDLIQTMYVTAIVDSLAKLNNECKDRANECYLATYHLMSSDCRRFGKLLDKMENSYSRRNVQCIRTLVKSHQLIITWK